jgi:hypothetical protein
MARPLTCPQCSASSALGDEFQLTQPYRAAGIGDVVGLTSTGALLVEWLDRGDPSHFSPPELTCYGCGHQWVTTRSYVKYGESDA